MPAMLILLSISPTITVDTVKLKKYFFFFYEIIILFITYLGQFNVFNN